MSGEHKIVNFGKSHKMVTVLDRRYEKVSQNAFDESPIKLLIKKFS